MLRPTSRPWKGVAFRVRGDVQGNPQVVTLRELSPGEVSSSRHSSVKYHGKNHQQQSTMWMWIIHTSVYYVGWSNCSTCIRGRRIQRRHFRLDQIQDGGRRPSWKTSNGHISATRHPIDFVFGSRVGFSGTTDPTAPFPVGSNSRWRPAAILENFKRPCLSDAGDPPSFHEGGSPADLRYKEEERKRPWEIAEKTAREECTLDWSLTI